MNYQEALGYIHSVQWRGSRLGLSRTRELMALLGNPEERLQYVHIAGTNGKGSTAAMLASICAQSGYRTGLYTSPFINRFNERMQINGTCIADEELAQLTDFVRPYAEGMEDPPTEFELITAIAFLYFLNNHCDIVILEVGLGGELDSTNVIPTPELAVITNIGYDHTRELGPTLEEITKAKAGIIKSRGTVVSYGDNSQADAVIQRACQSMNATLITPDFSLLQLHKSSLDCQIFDYEPYLNLQLGLIGHYQLYNAAVAITAVEALQQKGWRIGENAIRRGLAAVRWPARFEVLCHDPVVILDGGHNPQGISAVVESMEQIFPGRKFTLLMGVMADKDVDSMLACLIPIVKQAITVTPNNTRAMFAQELCKRMSAHGIPAQACKNIKEGVIAAMELAGQDGIVLALGSLYLSGDVRSILQQLAMQSAK